MYKIIAFFLGLVFATSASAQTCPTRPTTDASNACASTQFVKNKVQAVVPSVTGQASKWLWAYNNSTGWTQTQPSYNDLANLSTQLWGTPQTVTAAWTFSIPITGDFYWTQTGTGAVQRTAAAKLRETLSVLDFGAACNSNGVHGNGADDTAAIQAALDYAGSLGAELVFPRGVCRTTATLNLSATNHVYILKGLGYDSKLFNDSAAATATLTADASSYSGGLCPISLQPCVTVEGLTFIPPNVTSAGNFALSANANPHIRFNRNNVEGYRVGVSLSTSYAPEIKGNTFTSILSNAVYTAADGTGNNAKIIGNRARSVGATTSDAAFFVGGSVTALMFASNDIESNYAGAIFGALSGSTIIGNFIETSTSYNLYFTATASKLTMVGNWFGGSGATTLDISNSFIANNVGASWTVSWSAGSINNVAYNNPTGWATPVGAIGFANGIISGPTMALSAPVTKTANYTVDSGAVKDSSIIFDGSGSLTVTLPSASTNTGRYLGIKTVAAQTVVSASSNVVPLVGGAAGTAILAATAGKWARLQSDGTNWVIMEGN